MVWLQATGITSILSDRPGIGDRPARNVVGMPGTAMTITFHKRGRTCGWTALRPPRSVVPGTTMAAGGDLPHDLCTFVVEDALGIEHGFWGCVAAGATFPSLGRKRTPQGKAVIERHRDELGAAEVLVNEIQFAWRAGEPTELDRELDEMLGRWRAVPDGGDLVVEWTTTRPAAVRSARQSPRGPARRVPRQRRSGSSTR